MSVTKSAKKRKRKEVDVESDEEFPADLLSAFLQSAIGQAFARWSVESGFDVAAVSGQPPAFRKRLRAEVKKWRAAAMRVPKDGSCRMPLSEEIGLVFILIDFCDFQTALSVLDSCEPMRRAVTRKWQLASSSALKPLLAPLGIAARSEVTVIRCLCKQVPVVLESARCRQFMCVSQSAALFFVKSVDHWVVAVISDSERIATIGWKKKCGHFSQRPIASPITALTVDVSMQWQTAVNLEYDDSVSSVAKIENTIVFCLYNSNQIVLNAHTGAIFAELPRASRIAYLRHSELREYTFNFETGTKSVLVKNDAIQTSNVSADGKRLYDTNFLKQEIAEISTGWEPTVAACIPLIGKPIGPCKVAANGMLAQATFRTKEDGSNSFYIELIESNTRCHTQAIETKNMRFIREVAFSPNSSRIVSVSTDGTVRLFDVISGQIIGEPRVGHSDWVSAVCWLTDDWFVTVADNKSLCVWHCDSQQYAARVEHVHDSPIKYVLRLSNDSFVTSASNGSVKKWVFACE